MNVLVTGGMGYIGSHTCVELLKDGHKVIIVDNLMNSSIKVLDNIRKIIDKDIIFYQIDLCNEESLRRVFEVNCIDVVIHFAGLKAVGESVSKPIEYYYNNLTTTLMLCKIMNEYNVKKLIFSSSATVYGLPKSLPIKENANLQITNPYGRSKLIIEDILKDLYASDKKWGIVVLRYFNPVGAHESGLIGENPKGKPNNLMPYICDVVAEKLKCLNVFGNDYDTHDGTGVRDYIHVVDLAKGHIEAISKIINSKGIFTYNLGTGKGYSVLDMIKSFEKVNDVKVNYEIVGRRPGDIASCYADVTKAKKELHWVATKTIDDMCRDAWRFANRKEEDGEKYSL